MNELSGLFGLQFLMLVELGIGYFTCRLKIIKAEEREIISKLVINVFLPCSIVSSFDNEPDSNLFYEMVMIFVISCLIQVVCSIISRFGYQKADSKKKAVLQYATVCSNAGFMGNAIAEGVYGQLGLMLAQIYLIPVRIVMWSAGVAYFEGKKGNPLKTMQKIITHPCVIAVIIGLIRLFINVRIPSAIEQTMTSLGRCATPLIMIYIGMIISDAGFESMIQRDTIRYSIIRLLIIPGLVLIAVKLMNTDVVAGGISVLLAAMPAGTTTAVLAGQYKSDEAFAANVVVLTTLISIIILPLWVMLVNLVL